MWNIAFLRTVGCYSVKSGRPHLRQVNEFKKWKMEPSRSLMTNCFTVASPFRRDGTMKRDFPPKRLARARTSRARSRSIARNTSLWKKPPKSKSKKCYWAAVLRSGDLRQHGIHIEPRPEPNDPAHPEVPDLTCQNRDSVEALERQQRLVESCPRVEGPILQEAP